MASLKGGKSMPTPTPSSKTAAYGLRQLQICKLLEDPAKGGTPSYDPTWIDIPIQEINIDKNVNRIEERGNEDVLNIETELSGRPVSWQNAQIPFSALAAINGSKHTVNAAGNTILLEKDEDISGYFAIRCITKKTFDGKGPMGIMVTKCQGVLKVATKAGDFANCSFDGQAISRESDGLAVGYILLDKAQGIEAITEENLKPA